MAVLTAALPMLRPTLPLERGMAVRRVLDVDGWLRTYYAENASKIRANMLKL